MEGGVADRERGTGGVYLGTSMRVTELATALALNVYTYPQTKVVDRL